MSPKQSESLGAGASSTRAENVPSPPGNAPIGKTGGHAVSGPGFTAMLADLRNAHESFFPHLMGEDSGLA